MNEYVKEKNFYLEKKIEDLSLEEIENLRFKQDILDSDSLGVGVI